MGWIKNSTTTSSGGSLPYKYFKQKTAPVIFNPNEKQVNAHLSGTYNGSSNPHTLLNLVSFNVDVYLSGLNYYKFTATGSTGNIRVYEYASKTLLASATGTQNTGAAGTLVKWRLDTPIKLTAGIKYAIGFWFNDVGDAQAAGGQVVPHNHSSADGTITVTQEGLLNVATDTPDWGAVSGSFEMSYEYIIAANPTPKDTEAVAGDMWFDQTDNVYKFCDSSRWVYKPTSIVRAYRNTTASIPATTWTTLVYNTEVIDTDNEYAPTSGRFTAKLKGLYDISAVVQWDTAVSGNRTILDIFVNGAAHSRLYDGSVGSGSASVSSGSSIISLNAGDYVEFKVYTINALTVLSGHNTTYISITQIR